MAKPTDMGVKHPNGTYTFYEPVHVGDDEDGIDIWGYPEDAVFGPGDVPYIGTLPPHTGVEFPLMQPPVEDE